jgi:exonuclease III
MRSKVDALAPLPEPMKIASFNINNINRRLGNLLSWLREGAPDLVCLQELKAADTEFPAEAIRQAGYHAVWRDEKRWNGVAILAVARGRDSHGLAGRRRRWAMPHRSEWMEFGQ